MAAPLFLRRAKRGLKYTLAKVLVGDKATAPHFAWAGPGSAAQLCRQIADSGHRDILVVTDRALRDLGVTERALAGFAGRDVHLHYYDGVLPDPTFAQVSDGAALFRQHSCTAVLAVGGGSSMDAAKVIAACGDPGCQPREWVGRNGAPETAAPIYTIPTTAGTGSEATMGAVITDETDHLKHIVASPALLPRAAAVDADLMMGLPAGITAATGLDALTHGIEAYTAIWERGTRSEAARMAVTGVFRWLPVALAEPENLEARQGMSVAAYYGGVAINQVNVGTIHAIAHQLGARYGIPHGIANAMVMPHVLRVYGAVAVPRLAELADALGIAPGTAEEARAAALIDAIEALRDDSGLPGTSADIKPEDFAGIRDAALAEADGYFSPRLLTEAEFDQVLARLTPTGS